MGNLWHFFGLPDPDVGVAQRQPQATTRPSAPTLTNEPVEAPEIVVEEAVLASPVAIHIDDWNGPVTPDGEPFHDLSSLSLIHI